MAIDLVFVNIAYLMTFFALAIREIYWLRIVLTIAQFSHLSHAYLNLDYSKGFWTSVFVIINITQIVIIYLDRRNIYIPEEIKDLYDNIFHTQSKREFLKFWDSGKVCQVENDIVAKSGDVQADLMLILNGNADVVRKNKKVASLERGQFISEISYITGNPASADVHAKGELLFYNWDRASLSKFKKSNPIASAKLDRILTLDMANKLTRK